MQPYGGEPNTTMLGDFTLGGGIAMFLHINADEVEDLLGDVTVDHRIFLSL
jgi:hypothetical protein